MTDKRLLTPEEIRAIANSLVKRGLQSFTTTAVAMGAKAQLAKADKHRLDRPEEMIEWNELLEARIIYEVLAVEDLTYQEAIGKLKEILIGFEDHTAEDAEYEWKRDKEEQDG